MYSILYGRHHCMMSVHPILSFRSAFALPLGVFAHGSIQPNPYLKAFHRRNHLCPQPCKEPRPCSEEPCRHMAQWSHQALREGAANWDALLEMRGNSVILGFPVGVPWSRRPPRAGLSRPVPPPWGRKAPAAPSLPPPRPPAGRPPPYPWPPPPPAGGGARPARRVSNGPTAGRGGRAGRRAVPAWDFKAPFCAGRQDIDRRSAPGAQAAGRGEE